MLPGTGRGMSTATRSIGARTVCAAALTMVSALTLVVACKTPPSHKAHLDPVKVRVTALVPMKTLDPLLEDVEKRTFNFFWDTAEPGTGLMPDRWPKPPFSSVAAVGFALNAYCIGAERGYVTRAQARTRTLMTLKFLRDAQQGTSPDSASGYQGFFYHFVNFGSGNRYGDSELSTVDTALLMGGVLFAGGYFDQADDDEKQIRDIADELYKRVNWPWAIAVNPDIRMAWSPELEFGGHDWRGYNEAMLVFILALGSPTYPAAQRTWDAWTSDYYRAWGTLEGQTHLTFGPMFGHQFTHIWVDMRGIKDEFMWPQGFDYFENSRRAVLAQRAYAIRNPMDWKGYGPNIWGLSASDGPGNFELPYMGQKRKFFAYAARGVGLHETHDDGTIAPYAALGSLPFAPEVVLPAAQEMHKRYGRYIYGKYGFVDAFNPSFDYDVPTRHGKRVRGVGWVDTEYLGIDQGPIISMIENYRSELIWTVMKKNPYVRAGLKRAGFEGGWLE